MAGRSSEALLFDHDPAGQLIGLLYNGARYFYLRNGQGDITGIVDGSGTTVVQYTYSTWGELLSVTGSMAATLGQRNPFRYRGYYFDAETGLYYLKTRYYDPETCRFISADLCLSTGQGVLGYNGFAYCLNDPVGRADETGLVSFENAEGMRDVTEEVYAALDEECKIAPVIKAFASSDIVFFALIYPPVYVYFASIMYHNRKWDIKENNSWQNTIKTTYPGKNTVLFNNEPVTPENLGNITYGYIGAAYGIPLHILLVGSFAVATKNSMNDVIHGFKDHKDIRYGYFLYYKDQITGRRNRS